MKQTVCIITLLIGYIATAMAQKEPATASIRGRVLTEDRQPIEFANIALLAPDSALRKKKATLSSEKVHLLYT